MTERNARIAIRIQSISGKEYLTQSGVWTRHAADAALFVEAMPAIMLCIRFRLRDVRLVGTTPGRAEVYLYPFGRDPCVKAELKELRKNIRESRRLKADRNIIRARIDALMAGGKERRKQWPFIRQAVSQDRAPAISERRGQTPNSR